MPYNFETLGKIVFGSPVKLYENGSGPAAKWDAVTVRVIQDFLLNNKGFQEFLDYGGKVTEAKLKNFPLTELYPLIGADGLEQVQNIADVDVLPILDVKIRRKMVSVWNALGSIARPSEASVPSVPSVVAPPTIPHASKTAMGSSYFAAQSPGAAHDPPTFAQSGSHIHFYNPGAGPSTVLPDNERVFGRDGVTFPHHYMSPQPQYPTDPVASTIANRFDAQIIKEEEELRDLEQNRNQVMADQLSQQRKYGRATVQAARPPYQVHSTHSTGRGVHNSGFRNGREGNHLSTPHYQGYTDSGVPFTNGGRHEDSFRTPNIHGRSEPETYNMGVRTHMEGNPTTTPTYHTHPVHGAGLTSQGAGAHGDRLPTPSYPTQVMGDKPRNRLANISMEAGRSQAPNHRFGVNQTESGKGSGEFVPTDGLSRHNHRVLESVDDQIRTLEAEIQKILSEINRLKLRE